MQQAMLNPSVRDQLEVWAHSNFARASLDYAIALADSDAALCYPSANIDAMVARRRASGVHAELPFSRTIGKKGSQMRITIGLVDIRSPPPDLPSYDTVCATTNRSHSHFRAFCRSALLLALSQVATISFEHIEQDLLFIKRLQPGVNFVFGVATFANSEHHRFFKTAHEVLHI